MQDIQRGVIYGKGGKRDLKMDIYRPGLGPDDEENRHTAVLLLHGGGWRFGDISMMDIFGPELAKLGFTAIAPEYRLIGESPWPAQLEDVKSAIRWTRANAASLNIKPDNIALQGFSAGAHLALMAGGTPDRPEFSGSGDNDDISDHVAAVVAFFPPISFTTGKPAPGQTPASALLGESATEEDARKASPVAYISENYPPAFFLHGTADHIVSCTNSIEMFEKLREKEVFTELHLYPGHTHEFVRLPSMISSVESEIALFLKRAVVDPESYIRENNELNMFANRKE